MKITLCLSALAFAVGLSPGAVAGDFDVSATTPDVHVSTRPVGRNFMRLPTLRYEFVVSTNCPGPLSARSISLSIADTRVALDAGDLTADPPLRMTIDVPESQIAPVAVADFCTRREDAGETGGEDMLKIPSLLSAQAALTCADDESSVITYTSKSLDVVLRCEHSEGTAADSIR